jgi:protein-L-isoaspartate(D-aspartate) O-methyltransferase
MDYHELYNFYCELDRALFVSAGTKSYAKLDAPLPIGFGQTISQPSLVLEMTRLLMPEKNSRVLEIGTGSGYQTALLSHMSAEVFTVELIKQLSDRAKALLDSLGFSNVRYSIGDGSAGWPEFAPYDRIMVTAAASAIPSELVEQLSPGGRMIIPVGPEHIQELLLVVLNQAGEPEIENIELVRFVELKGRYGWQ